MTRWAHSILSPPLGSANDGGAEEIREEKARRCRFVDATEIPRIGAGAVAADVQHGA
jgi:hypothetical protein